MTCNVGGVERPIRIILGLAFLGLGFLGDLPPAGMWGAIVVGAVALITGAVGYCPAWALFGINTCPTNPVNRKT